VLRYTTSTEYTKHATLKAHSDQTESHMRRVSRAVRVLLLRACSSGCYMWGEIWFAVLKHGSHRCWDVVCDSSSAPRSESVFLLWDAAPVLCVCEERFSSQPLDERFGWARMIAVSFKCRCQILRRVNKGTVSLVFILGYTSCSPPR